MDTLPITGYISPWSNARVVAKGGGGAGLKHTRMQWEGFPIFFCSKGVGRHCKRNEDTACDRSEIFCRARNQLFGPGDISTAPHTHTHTCATLPPPPLATFHGGAPAARMCKGAAKFWGLCVPCRAGRSKMAASQAFGLGQSPCVCVRAS